MGRMGDLLPRVITGLVIGGIGLMAVLFGQYTFLVLVVVINALTLHEFYHMLAGNTGYSGRSLRIANMLRQVLGFGILLLVAGWVLHWWPVQALALLGLVVPVLIIAELFIGANRVASNISANTAGFLYITVPIALLILIGFQEGVYNYRWIVGLMLLVIVNDVFAYFTGRFLGRTKLMERISPKKTVEGFVGGAVFTMLAGVGIFYWFGLRNMTDWLVLAGIVVVFGTLGDLAESMLKRNMQVKDSGTLLPGHGGLLDRFDALLLSAPFWAAYLFLT
jgi:phosphatidate cytidylyltransferase